MPNAITLAQNVVSLASSMAIGQSGLHVLTPSMPVSYAYYRTMRKQPTIALARRLSIAPLLRASWAVEGPDADDGTVKLTQKTVAALRYKYMAHALRGLYDFGSASFEQFLDDKQNLRLKPLLNDLVAVIADGSGAFVGLKVGAPVALHAVYLDASDSVFIGLDVEAGSHFGVGSLEIARETYSSWKEADAGAKRYDRKIAGTTLVLFYPAGQGPDAVTGAMVNNYKRAGDLLKILESSGSVALESDREGFLADAQRQLPPSWRVEYKSDTSPRQGAFVERQRYLDALFVRSFCLPEKAILEGNFGSYAEAVAKQNLALVAMEALHEFLAMEFEQQVLRPYLTLILDEERASRVTITAGPVSGEQILWKRQVTLDMLARQPSALDFDALLDEVGLPKSKTIVQTLPEGGNNGE